MAKPSKNSRIRPKLAALLVLIATGCADRAIDPDAPAAHFFSDPQVAALAAAAEAGDVARIDELVASGVDVNATGRGNITPLFRALVAENKAGYEALLRHGASPNILARVLAGNAAVVHYAADQKDPFWLKTALEHGGDPNLKNAKGLDGEPPVYYAIAKSFQVNSDPPYAQNVRLLIDSGADVHAKWGPHYTTALLCALQKNHYETALVLIQAGADTSVSCVEGQNLAEYMTFMTKHLDILAPDQVEWFWKVADVLNKRGANIQRNGSESMPQSDSKDHTEGDAKYKANSKQED